MSKREDQMRRHGNLIAWLIAIVGVFYLVDAARADVVTEFGMGVKLPNTSQVLLPACQTIIVPAESPLPRAGGRAGCGGNNPAFIGWPIAWEKTFKHRVWRVRAGWFHYSNWFDGGNYFNGGDRWETHMDLAAVTVSFNWSAWTRKRKP